MNLKTWNEINLNVKLAELFESEQTLAMNGAFVYFSGIIYTIRTTRFVKNLPTCEFFKNFLQQEVFFL